MRRTAILLSVAITLALSIFGCNTEETRSVEWYLKPEHKAALDAKLAECKNNPGELKDTPNCINARAAAERIFLGGKFEKVREPDFGFGSK